MHCQIKEVTGKKCGNGTTTCVEAKDGTIIMEKDKILDRWSEYIGELYDDDEVSGATKCEKHRTISLMSHITKLVV